MLKRSNYKRVVILYCVYMGISLYLPMQLNAQSIGINTSGAIPDSSAMLDILSANKGLLIPRVSLSSVTDSTTIAHPAVSLQVYNTNDSMTGGQKGFWYWNGTQWVHNISALGADSLVVGADTSSHLYNLQVAGTAGVTESLTTPLIIGGVNTTDSLVYKTTTANGTTGADHIFKVGNNGGTEALRISNSGNVGIRTSSPTYGLDINLPSMRIIRRTDDTYGSTIVAGKSRGTVVGSETTLLDGDEVGSLLFQGYDGTAFRNSSMVRGVVNGTPTGSTSVPGRLIFYTAPAGSGLARRMSIWSDGKVSIGDFAAAAKLDVKGEGSTNATNNFRIQNSSSTVLLQVNDAGQVGVGTDSPNGQLTIGMAGYSALKTWNSVDKAGFDFTRVSAPNYTRTFDIYAIGAGTGTGEADIRFINNPPSSATGVVNLIIKGSGNVGIGTTTPSAKLHLLSTTEQLRLGYDASNYYSTTVGSSGAITFDATGSGAAFSFSDAVSLANNSTASTQALNDSTTKIATTAFVDRAIAGVSGGSGWGLTGNSGTTDGTNFIGTTDNKPFNIKVNNQKAGRIDNTNANVFFGYQNGNSISTGAYNTSVGQQAMYSATSASYDVAIGYQALYSNTTGNNNAAVGHKAMYTNSTGYYNSAIGYNALYSNTSGTQNTATGYTALYTNSTGQDNTAIGQQTLYYNTASYNTACGSYALTTNSSGERNTALGMSALTANTTGSYNMASGKDALLQNTTGSYNASAGNDALFSNTTGSYNTSVGYHSGSTNTTGSSNTYVGYNSDANANNYNNATAIGNGAIATGSNYIKIGNSSVSTIAGQVGWTTLSDSRFKTNISDTDIKGLDFIMRLRPVSYNVDTRKYEEFLTKNMSDSIKIKHFEGRDFSKSTAKRHNGFIAQEIETAAQASGYEFSGIHKPETDDDNYGLTYSDFVVPLVKAVQEQQQQIEAKENIITVLQAKINQLEQRVQQLEKH